MSSKDPIVDNTGPKAPPFLRFCTAFVLLFMVATYFIGVVQAPTSLFSVAHSGQTILLSLVHLLLLFLAVGLVLGPYTRRCAAIALIEYLGLLLYGRDDLIAGHLASALIVATALSFIVAYPNGRARRQAVEST